MMLSIEQKRQIFIKLRKENYQASLRLEGFQTSQTAPVKKTIAPTPAELKASMSDKYGVDQDIHCYRGSTVFIGAPRAPMPCSCNRFSMVD